MRWGIVVGAPTCAAQVVAAERRLEEVVHRGLHASSTFDQSNDKTAQHVDQARGEHTDRWGGLALKSAAGTATNLAALVRRICEGSLPKSNLTNSDELSPRPVDPIHGHHLHRPFLIETHHRHLTPHLYHGLAIA